MAVLRPSNELDYLEGSIYIYKYCGFCRDDTLNTVNKLLIFF